MEKGKDKKKREEKKIGLVFFRVFWKSQASHQQCPIQCRELETHNLPGRETWEVLSAQRPNEGRSHLNLFLFS